VGTVAIGRGVLGLAAIYSTNPNACYDNAEWVVAAEYAVKATDKMKIAPAVLPLSCGSRRYDEFGCRGL
jgi:hypothetical protein